MIKLQNRVPLLQTFPIALLSRVICALQLCTKSLVHSSVIVHCHRSLAFSSFNRHVLVLMRGLHVERRQGRSTGTTSPNPLGCPKRRLPRQGPLGSDTPPIVGRQDDCVFRAPSKWDLAARGWTQKMTAYIRREEIDFWCRIELLTVGIGDLLLP